MGSEVREDECRRRFPQHQCTLHTVCHAGHIMGTCFNERKARRDFARRAFRSIVSFWLTDACGSPLNDSVVADYLACFANSRVGSSPVTSLSSDLLFNIAANRTSPFPVHLAVTL